MKCKTLLHPSVLGALFCLGVLTIYLKTDSARLAQKTNLIITSDIRMDSIEASYIGQRSALYGQINCPALWAGKETAIKKANMLSTVLKHQTLLPSYYREATKNCSEFRTSRAYRTTPLTEEEREFPIAYIITIHKNIEQVERLLRALYMPQNVYCIHVDKSASTDFQSAVKAIADCLPNVKLSQKQETIVYAGYPRLAADLHCLEDLFEQDKTWKYVANVAGQEFPLKTNREMVQHLKSLKGKNIIPSYKASGGKSDRYKFVHYMPAFQEGYPNNLLIKPVRTDHAKSDPPNNITIYVGSAYFVASREFMQFTLTARPVKQLLSWCKDTYSPDEIFWATLQRMKGVPGAGSGASNAHAIKWLLSEQHGKYEACRGIHQRNVCVYGVGDLPWLTTSDKLIANKFEPSYDPVALHCMEEWITHKRRVYAQDRQLQKRNNTKTLL